MSFILSIETATTNCSVCLSKDGKTIAIKEDFNTQFSHAERLHVYIDSLLHDNEITPVQLNAIAVSKGPGSYTGLRIGVSAAKGLCFALSKPLIAIPTLTSLAHQVAVDDGCIAAILDARRMEVYSAVFDSNYQQIRNTEAEILDAHSFNEYLDKGKVYFLGTGIEKIQSTISHPNAVFINNKLPSANEMSKLAYEKYKISNFEDVAYFEPFYLKDFIAIKSKS